MIGKIARKINLFLDSLYLRVLRNRRGILIGSNIKLYGRPIIVNFPYSTIEIDEGVVICSLDYYNAIGVNHRTIIRTFSSRAKISIGKNSGLSGASIAAVESVEIGRDCLIGANVIISDTDFHPIEPIDRRHSDISKARSRPVKIGNNVFIGTSSIVLKGVSIGDNSIIGAGSVVVGNVPSNVVFAGNPARLIRTI